MCWSHFCRKSRSCSTTDLYFLINASLFYLSLPKSRIQDWYIMLPPQTCRLLFTLFSWCFRRGASDRGSAEGEEGRQVEDLQEVEESLLHTLRYLQIESQYCCCGVSNRVLSNYVDLNKKFSVSCFRQNCLRFCLCFVVQNNGLHGDPCSNELK